eukprot:scaffold68854_cov70-Phaeocystis_antarctica.AAC.5
MVHTSRASTWNEDAHQRVAPHVERLGDSVGSGEEEGRAQHEEGASHLVVETSCRRPRGRALCWPSLMVERRAAAAAVESAVLAKFSGGS